MYGTCPIGTVSGKYFLLLLLLPSLTKSLTASREPTILHPADDDSLRPHCGKPFEYEVAIVRNIDKPHSAWVSRRTVGNKTRYDILWNSARAPTILPEAYERVWVKLPKFDRLLALRTLINLALP